MHWFDPPDWCGPSRGFIEEELARYGAVLRVCVIFHGKDGELLRDVRYVLSAERFEGTCQVYLNTHRSHSHLLFFVLLLNQTSANIKTD